MELLSQFIDIFLHLDQHLGQWAAQMGPGLYLLLFGVVFCETGLVVTPFLPGDSLLFATGALVALPETGLGLELMIFLLIVAAILGDAVNYWVGARLGQQLMARAAAGSRLVRKEHLERTKEFYERYGAKTIVIARFVPIVRTFAPFVAGLGKMNYRRFALFNVTGAVLWVTGFVLAGYFFGNLPGVKRNFQWVILGIIVLSVAPAVFEVLRSRSGRSGDLRV
ncbi:MAG: DedA family protein [Oligoflexia bacterium]